MPNTIKSIIDYNQGDNIQVKPKEDWNFMDDNSDPTELVNKFENFNSQLMEKIIPEKEITISSVDKLWMTLELEICQCRCCQYTQRKFNLLFMKTLHYKTVTFHFSP